MLRVFIEKKMDSIIFNRVEEKGSEIVEVKKRGRGSKRKEEYNNRKAKRAVAAMLESI